MAMTPTFLGPDGKYREHYIFTTDVLYRFFAGQMDSDTADMQVSIRGGGFSANPDYIQFEGTSFIIPNPSAYPEGLQLFPGANRIEVKSVLTNGEATAVGLVEANLSVDRDIRAVSLAPAGVYIERLDRTIKLVVTGLSDPDVVGYNFYASISPGGGVSGYKKISLQPVISYTTEESTTDLGTLGVDADVVLNNDGSPAASPLYLRTMGMQINQAGEELQGDFDEALVIPDAVTRFRVNTSVSAVSVTKKFTFIHDRAAQPTDPVHPAVPYNEFQAIPSEDPLYYTVTAIYYINGVEYESAMSPEVSGTPLVVTPQVADLPAVTRQQIVRDTVLSIFRSHPEVDVKPGTYLRDTFIDPFSTEAERIRFIVGFLQAGQSFTTLLAIDDPNSTGASISVQQSATKLALLQAFYLQDTQSVQNLIDNAFDHLAARRGLQRRSGQRARGEVIFYVTRRPTSTRYIPIGTIVASGGIQFRTVSAARISPSGVGTTYNPATGRWSTRAYVQAVTAGESGNLTRNQITTIQGGPTDVQVTNPDDTYGGRNTESNFDLAVRADGVLASVDSGTYRGYMQKATGVAGVRQANVVEAGHTLMMRDLDVTTGRHWGGKVDVWVRGESIANIMDTFAFSFETVIDGQFEPVGDIGNLRFRAVNPSLSAANPIMEILNIPDWNIEFRDVTAGISLNLQGAEIIPPDGLQLSALYNDPTLIRIRDEYRGSYRFRTSNKHVFVRQPVTEITSFTQIPSAGTQRIVSPSAYNLFHPSDPMDLGRSTEAGDYLRVVDPLDGTPVENIPTGVPIVVTGEGHVLLQGPEYLNNLGVSQYTIHIYNVERTIEYNGPFHPTTDKDFTLINEDGEIPVAFVPVTGGRLLEGMRVLVDYQHDENYLVSYTTNSVVQTVQNVLEESRHCTADVVVKETIPMGVDISGTVVVLKNQSTSMVDGNIRTALGRLFGALSLGQPLRQSDVIQAIESVQGVSYAVVPLTHMALQDGAIIVRETVVTSQSGTDWVRLTNSGWETSAINVYLVNTPLYSNTLNGGGAENEFRGVFFDDVPLTLYPSIPQYDGTPLKGTPYGACIIGNAGMSIPGHSGVNTANRVLIALPSDISPSDGTLKVTYIAEGDDGVKNIEPGPTEYLVLGDLDFIYDEDKDFSSLVTGRRI